MTDVILDGNTLTPETLLLLGHSQSHNILIPEDAWKRVHEARNVITQVLLNSTVVYGITTGFGKFESVLIAPDQLEALQYNLIRSHCAGVGSPINPVRARMMLALRINILAKGYSGIRPETLKKMVEIFNAKIIPFIPRKGTVGASGDLAPLAHLALGMIGEGQLATLGNVQFRPAAEVLAECGISPITLQAKEGLALINGTQFITAHGSEALVRARRLARMADIIAAVSMEALLWRVGPFNPEVHEVRAHKGQRMVAERIRSVLHSEKYPSKITEKHVTLNRVQDAYSIRCIPQVHGVVSDMIEFVYSIINVELNSATDNPLVFPHAAMKIVSGGNFHGEYPAKALDVLSLAVAELGSISERRIERLNNPALGLLPAFLVRNGGINSGFMIAHVTSAALVAENRVLTVPASADNISTSAAQEDHVSMGGFAARKALKIVENVETILTIELLCACQGIDLLRPCTSTEPLEKIMVLVRSVSKMWEVDRVMSTDIEVVSNLIRSDAVWNAIKEYVPAEAHFQPPPLAHFLSPTSSKL